MDKLFGAYRPYYEQLLVEESRESLHLIVVVQSVKVVYTKLKCDLDSIQTFSTFLIALFKLWLHDCKKGK